MELYEILKIFKKLSFYTAWGKKKNKIKIVDNKRILLRFTKNVTSKREISNF